MFYRECCENMEAAGRQVESGKWRVESWNDAGVAMCRCRSSDLLPRQMSRKGDAAVTLAAAQKWNGATAGTRTTPFRFLHC